jgi:hypothetical protein
MEEELLTLKDIAEKIEMPLGYVKNFAYRPHYRKCFEKRIAIFQSQQPNGKLRLRSYKYKCLKPEYEEYFLSKIIASKNEYLRGCHSEMNRTTIPEVFNWTLAAAECYFNRMTCEFCKNNQICEKAAQYFYDKKPPMKKAVLELVRKLGKPPYKLAREIEEIA